jgi:tetratricopeptide (TPR) repeat protein
MSKPLLVTLPFLLLLLDYWPLRRIPLQDAGQTGMHRSAVFRQQIRGPVLEKLPMMVPVALISVSTLMAQKFSGAVIPSVALDLKTRLANALVSYAGYLSKTFWPVDLSVYYAYRDASSILWPAVGAFLLLALMTAAALRWAKPAPYLPVGWFWFLGTLVPMIGLVQVGTQAMADRYMYLPLVGIGIMLIWGCDDLWRKKNGDRRVLAVAAAAVLIALSVATHRQVGHWETSLTLFRHAVRIDPKNDLAHNNLGAAYQRQGDLQQAVRHYRRAVELNPFSASAASNLAGQLSEAGDLAEAERLYRRAIELDPAWAPYRYNYGILLFQRGRIEDAVTQFAEALAIDPSLAEVHNYMGVALARQGNTAQAVRFFSRALELDPGFAPAERNLKRWQNRDQGQP